MGCEGIARAILLVFNLLFFLIGAATLGIGIWVVVDGAVFLQVLSNIPADTTLYASFIADAAYILIGAGAFIFLVGFLGCCGAWKKSQCLLLMYAVIVGIILVLEIACVVVAYFFYGEVALIVNTHLALALNATYDSKFVATTTAGEYTYTPGGIMSKGIDAIQVEFACCGVNNYTDYRNGAFPVTCCPASDADVAALASKLWGDNMPTYTTTALSCPGNITYAENVQGCLTAITDYVNGKSVIFMAIGGATLGIQVLIIIFASLLIKSLGDDENKD